MKISTVNPNISPSFSAGINVDYRVRNLYSDTFDSAAGLDEFVQRMGKYTEKLKGSFEFILDSDNSVIAKYIKKSGDVGASTKLALNELSENALYLPPATQDAYLVRIKTIIKSLSDDMAKNIGVFQGNPLKRFLKVLNKIS